MLEKLSKMSIREAMITLAGGPPEYGAQVRWLLSIAKKVEGLSFRMARSLWLSEIKSPDHWAARAIRQEAELQKARREAKELASLYESIAGSLNAKDQDFYSPDVNALVHAARILRGLDRSRTDGGAK